MSAEPLSPTGPHAELAARHRQVMPSWIGLYYDEPIELVSGQGRRVVDGEGRTYLDFFGGILTTMTGHAVPEVVEAVTAQAGRLLHSSTLYLIRPMVELAERIAELSGIPDAKVFFVNSGSEANDLAVQLDVHGPALEPGAGPAPQLPRPVVRVGRHHRDALVVGLEPDPGQRELRARRLPLPQPLQGPAG